MNNMYSKTDVKYYEQLSQTAKYLLKQSVKHIIGLNISNRRLGTWFLNPDEVPEKDRENTLKIMNQELHTFIDMFLEETKSNIKKDTKTVESFSDYIKNQLMLNN